MAPRWMLGIFDKSFSMLKETVEYLIIKYFFIKRDKKDGAGKTFIFSKNDTKQKIKLKPQEY